jgi:hypothetical protein
MRTLAETGLAAQGRTRPRAESITGNAVSVPPGRAISEDERHRFAGSGSAPELKAKDRPNLRQKQQKCGHSKNDRLFSKPWKKLKTGTKALF